MRVYFTLKTSATHDYNSSYDILLKKEEKKDPKCLKCPLMTNELNYNPLWDNFF